MLIAVTYDENGQVFQHFGHTELFKLYQVEEGQVVKSGVFGSNGYGHEALADLLWNGGVDVLICGGIGGGAQMAIAQAGIKLCAGVHGDADEAVAAYLAGKLNYSESANCDHHHHEEGGCCGEHEEGGCGHGESGEGCHCHEEGENC